MISVARRLRTEGITDIYASGHSSRLDRDRYFNWNVEENVKVNTIVFRYTSTDHMEADMRTKTLSDTEFSLSLHQLRLHKAYQISTAGVRAYGNCDL
jgi:hypothetical protein